MQCMHVCTVCTIFYLSHINTLSGNDCHLLIVIINCLSVEFAVCIMTCSCSGFTVGWTEREWFIYWTYLEQHYTLCLGASRYFFLYYISTMFINNCMVIRLVSRAVMYVVIFKNWWIKDKKLSVQVPLDICMNFLDRLHNIQFSLHLCCPLLELSISCMWNISICSLFSYCGLINLSFNLVKVGVCCVISVGSNIRNLCHQ